MKNHWLEKRRTREQREKVLKDIAKKGLGHFTSKQQPILWFAPQGLKRGKVPTVKDVFEDAMVVYHLRREKNESNR